MSSTGRNDNAFKLHGANISKLLPLTILHPLKKHCTYEIKDSANIQLAFQNQTKITESFKTLAISCKMSLAIL